MNRKSLFLALALGSLAFSSAQADDDSFHSPPVVDSKKAGRMAAARADFLAMKGGEAKAAAVTREEVGDADSFGRKVKWLGLVAGSISLSADCTPAPGNPADPNCVTLAAAPGSTSFNVPDVASMTLPGRSSRSLLCHWQTPIVYYFAQNNTGVTQTFDLRLRPTYRIESEVLDEPGLVDPGTGLPYGGAIETTLTAFIKSGALGAGEFESEYDSGTRVCIGSLISKHSLMAQWGLSEAQARRFFRRPITITMGISGNARMVESASLYFGTRFVGD